MERIESLLHAVPITVFWRKETKDVDLLALALHLGVTIWTNDRDFSVCGLPIISTAQLLAQTQLVP